MTPSPAGASFSERLLPGPGGWIGVVVTAAILGLAATVASTAAAVVTGLVALAVGVLLAWAYSPVVAVRDGELVAGKAHIPLALLGEATVLDRAEVLRAMGTEWDPRAFACLRTWAGGGVRVKVTDPADPTPYWIVSSRRARDLAAALTAP
ncbi:Protein of unknown function [Sanguibacter gelidistatuariae]|uniref:DUF3093 domain-containing protein n=1 Tax=Sanguibacter gelidistatuariae TaxID=1814289 RepID=A0A1G6RIX6_9MICO|nr:Protein of unknown function [Sanguibacter gelidistatuariae]